MNFLNTKFGYGLVTVVIHWLMAILIVGLFVLGIYMVELDYYDKWYNAAPWWHKGIGMLTFILLVLRIIWITINKKPDALSSYHRWEIIAASVTHYGFYLLLLIISISGYFITTAKGAPIDMFGLFDIPAITSLEKNSAEWTGEIHKISAYIMSVLFFLHVCASLKHHFFDKDITFVRMLKPIDLKEKDS